MREFFTDFQETAVEHGELITAITVPRQPEGSRGAFAKMRSLSENDWPCASAAVLAVPEDRWSRPVHFHDMAAAGSARTLFRHRPTSFACKWEELRHSESTGEAPRLPISFRTSLLETTAAPFDCPVPDGP